MQNCNSTPTQIQSQGDMKRRKANYRHDIIPKQNMLAKFRLGLRHGQPCPCKRGICRGRRGRPGRRFHLRMRKRSLHLPCDTTKLRQESQKRKSQKRQSQKRQSQNRHSQKRLLQMQLARKLHAQSRCIRNSEPCICCQPRGALLYCVGSRCCFLWLHGMTPASDTKQQFL